MTLAWTRLHEDDGLEGGYRLQVKGRRTYKESMPVEAGEVEIEREGLRASVVAVDLRTGRFEVIEH